MDIKRVRLRLRTEQLWLTGPNSRSHSSPRSLHAHGSPRRRPGHCRQHASRQSPSQSVRRPQTAREAVVCGETCAVCYISRNGLQSADIVRRHGGRNGNICCGSAIVISHLTLPSQTLWAGRVTSGGYRRPGSGAHVRTMYALSSVTSGHRPSSSAIFTGRPHLPSPPAFPTCYPLRPSSATFLICHPHLPSSSTILIYHPHRQFSANITTTASPNLQLQLANI